MVKFRYYTVFITVLLAISACSSSVEGNQNYINNASPLEPNPFIELPLGSIQAQGWLKEMLIRQKNGATGHLDELYPEVMGQRNGWLGGDGDQWERGPYWIDGLLPLAYILKDEELIAKTTPWIEWILASGKEDGYFGPDTDYSYEPGLQRDNCQDWWPRMVVLKILQQYYSATSDERVIGLMTNYFKYQLAELRERPLDYWTFWARMRGGDNLMSVYWLYNITHDDFLLDLGELLYGQTEPYTELFLSRDMLTRVGTIHGVNLAQGIKTPIVYYQYDRNPKYTEALECALDDIYKYQGYPTGMFSVDEAIHGNDPTQGVELCSIVEYMFSLETMYRITANPRYAELLEKIAFNALPAQTDDDYTVRQYFQQVNQVRASRHDRNFDVNHDGLDCTFGLLTGYPCCTSNMHQGWPKFTQNLWYATSDGGLAAAVYSPSRVRAKVADGVDVVVAENTDYPFEESIEMVIEELSESCGFPMVFRIPEWAVQAEIKVNGNVVDARKDDNNLVRIERNWEAGDVISLGFDAEVRLSVWKENARAVERGPLVYSLKVDSECRRVEMPENLKESQGDCYYEYLPVSPWNYALCESGDIQNSYRVEKSGMKGDYPWNEGNAPIRILTTGRRVKNWTEYNEMAGPVPYSVMYRVKVEEPEAIELIPYGCTTLRITEFPLLGRQSAEK